MIWTQIKFVATLIMALLLPCILFAQEIAAPQAALFKGLKPGTDSLGDPLPPGAVGRFGTARIKGISSECLAVSPDGKSFAVLGRISRDSVYLWELRTGKLLLEIHEEGATIGKLAFSADSKILAAGCMNLHFPTKS